MKDLETINKEREGRINLSQHKNLIETISKVEYKKFSKLGLIDLSEVIIALSETTQTEHFEYPCFVFISNRNFLLIHSLKTESAN